MKLLSPLVLLASVCQAADLAARYFAMGNQLVTRNSPPKLVEPQAGSHPPLARAVSSLASTATSLLPSTTPKPANEVPTPTPVQPGTIAGCKAFYKVQKNDHCIEVARINNITLQDFLKWNPEVDGGACTNLWFGYYVCVSVTESPPPATTLTTSTTSTTSTTTTTTTAITTPTPTQDGMVRNCKTFHWVEPSQTCETIAALYGVTSADIISWNPAAGPECKELWAHTYCCVGVASKPVPA
ncbi:hypothetical protein CDD82_2458 [Ophiocordyceps australis]|uniref:LysM domain-containing protein n=1 Tax=Ophiocordyceps australis TaxID=1399860 RepID=A0A2C5YYU8_9HYPO|nr:hypothetical protein CDD82_2458 [Ophiocordyceps australis]